MISALAGIGASAIVAAWALTAHLCYRAGRLTGCAQMLDGMGEYLRVKRISEADTRPSLLALMEAAQATSASQANSTPKQQEAS